MKKVLFFFLAILLSFSSLSLSAQSVIVANGTVTNSYIPFYGFYLDDAQHNQVIYPESMLTDLVGESITGMIFYLATTPSSTWTSSITLSLGVTTNTGFTSATHDTAPVTPYYTGSIPQNGDVVTFMFDSAYVYNGGNLLLDITTTASNYSSASFFGITQNGASMYSYSSTYTQNFIPKTNFIYGNCMAPSDLSVDSVSQTTALISWSPGGTETAWEVYVGNATDDLNNVTWTSVTDTTYEFQNLSPSTLYTAFVRADCGGEQSYAISTDFRTECGITGVPYTENFETYASYEQPVCWSFMNEYTGYSGNYPCVYNYSYYSHNGNCSLEFIYGTGDLQLAVLPLFDQDLTDLQISLYSRREGSSSGTFHIGYMTDPDVDSTFVSVFSVTSAEMGDDEYHKHIVDFSNVQLNPGDTAYIALGYYCASNWYWFVDDIEVELIPACSEPSGLTTSSITTTTATVSWTPGTSTTFNLYYKSYYDTAYTEVLSIADTSYLLENLSSSSYYQWYVVAICDDGSLQTSEPSSFNTSCGALTTLPYTCDFEPTPGQTADIPHCWTRGNLTTSYPYNYNYDYYAHSGNYSLYFYETNTIALPQIDATEIDITNLQLSFYATCYSDATLQIGVMTNPSVSSSFVPVGNPLTISPDDYNQYEVSLASYTGTGTYIAIKNTSDYTSVYLDDLTLGLLPDCTRPEAVTLMTADTVSAVITWNAADGQNGWEVAVGSHGFSPDTVTADYVSTNTYQLQNLTPNTTYDVYVRTECGSEFSQWSNVFSFTTLITAPATIPYSCDFEDATENSSWVILDADQTNKWYIDTAANNTDLGQYAMYISSDSGATNNYVNTTSVSWAYRDIQFSDANEFILSFDWRAYGESCCDYLRVFIGSPSAVTPGTNATPAGAVQIGQYNASSSWNTVSVSLNGTYSNTTRRLYVMWRNDGSLGDAPAGAIDNISIVGVDCAQPIALNVTSADTTSAEVVITPASANDTEWEIMYGTSVATMTTIVVNDLTNTLTGLNPASEYTVFARTLCSSGDTSAWTPAVTFQTECSLITTVPQTWDFESNNNGGTDTYPLPTCWERGSSTYYPYVYSYNGHNNSAHSFYFYNYYMNSVALTAIDNDVLPINTLQVSFFAKATSLDSYSAYLLVGVLSDVDDPTTFTVVDTVDLTATYPSEPYVVMFNNYTGTGNRIAFKNGTNDSDAYNSIYIDDLVLDLVPSCLPVSNLTTTVANMNELTMSWTPGDSEGSWNVEYKEASDSVWTATTASAIPFTITGLTSGTVYDVRVQADCGGGDVSPWITTQTNTTLCDTADQCAYTFILIDSYGDSWNGGYLSIQQGGITVAVVEASDHGGGAIQSYDTVAVSLCDNLATTLVWTAGDYASEASFIIIEPFGEVIYNSPSMTSYTTYTFTTACTPPTCPTPASISVANIGSTTADISWVSTGTETAWNIEYKLASDPTWTVVPVTTNPYTLTGLTAATAYDVRVQADCGAGDFSDYRTTSFTTAVCTAADQCAYTFILGDSYGDGWNNGSLTVKQGDATVTVLAATNHQVTSTQTYDTVVVNLCDDISTSLVWNTGSFDSEASFTLIGPDGSEVYSATSMSSYTTYTFTTDCDGGSAITCDAPTALAVNSITQTSAIATWTAGGTETSWNVEYKEASATTWQTATVSAATYTMTGLTANTAYEVRVQAACDASTTSDWTTAVSFTTLPADVPTCPAPTNLAATVDHTDVTLTWQQEANTASEWQINYRQTTESTWSTVTATTTTYTLTDLVANVTYEANVVAHCDNGLNSEPSNTVTFETNNNGVQTYLEKSVSLYPNPATEIVSVAVSDASIQISSVEVYNVYGQLINVIESNDNPLRINVSGLADGMYYVRVTTDGGVVTKNFVKR
ncbi:MAG: fibronectin type III domain-containing protein [Bacteroidales bacterium]|nr:fibronectin type III domain-containing protein [Bacteroidales bacterium]